MMTETVLPTSVVFQQFLDPSSSPTIHTPSTDPAISRSKAFRFPLGPASPELLQVAAWFRSHGARGDVEKAPQALISHIRTDVKSEQTHVFLQARLWTNIPARKTLRWHCGACFWRKLLPKDFVQVKYGCVLAGSLRCISSLFLRMFRSWRKRKIKAIKLGSRKGNVGAAEVDPRSNAEAAAIEERINIELTKAMEARPQRSAQALRQCAKWVIEGREATYYSEPWTEALRAFVACTPGTKEQVESMDGGMFS